MMRNTLEEKSNTVEQNSEFTTIIQNAHLSDNRLIADALKQEREFREVTEYELSFFLNKIETKFPEIDLETVQPRMMARINTDEQSIIDLNSTLRSSDRYKPGINVTWSLWTNKLTAFEESGQKKKGVLEGGRDFLAAHLSELGTNVIEEYDYHAKSRLITVLGDQTSIFGNSKATYFKTAVIYAYLEFYEKSLLDFPELPSQQGPWLNHSCIAHATYMPPDLQLDQSNHPCTFFLETKEDVRIVKKFAFPHSGYAFGGHYKEPKKLWAPEDCSSWVTKLAGCEAGVSTIDLWRAYHVKEASSERVAPSAEWIKSPAGTEALSHFESIKVRDPQRDIKPGDIYVHRFFKDAASKQQSEGTSGHTMLVLGVRNDGKKVVTLGYERNMPECEGFGVDEFSTLSTETIEPIFLRPK